jgi:hypothetical protein
MTLGSILLHFHLMVHALCQALVTKLCESGMCRLAVLDLVHLHGTLVQSYLLHFHPIVHTLFQALMTQLFVSGMHKQAMLYQVHLKSILVQ